MANPDRFAVQLESRLRDPITRLAHEQRRTVSAQVSLILDRYLAALAIKQGQQHQPQARPQPTPQQLEALGAHLKKMNEGVQ
jgi:hypothetical protein